MSERCTNPRWSTDCGWAWVNTNGDVMCYGGCIEIKPCSAYPEKMEQLRMALHDD